MLLARTQGNPDANGHRSYYLPRVTGDQTAVEADIPLAQDLER